MLSISRRFRHTGLPVGEVGSEVVDGEGGGLFVGPMRGNAPQHVRVRGGFFGEGGPLRIAHYAASTIFFGPGELASSDEWRRRRPRIATLRGHKVGKIQTSGGDTNQRLSGLQDRIGSVLNGKPVRPGEAGDHQGFHGESLAGCEYSLIPVKSPVIGHQVYTLLRWF